MPANVVAALSVDPLLPDPFDGIVVAVGDRTISIRTASDDLVTLACPQLCDGPNRVRLDVPVGHSLAGLLDVACGAPARRHGTLLRLGHALEIVLEGSPTAAARSDSATAPWNGCAGTQALPLPRNAGEADRWPEARREAFVRALSMAQQAAAGDTEGFLEHARSLVGLGPGLTPSGDDILVGFLAAARAAPESPAARVGESLRRELPCWVRRTGFVSGAYLRFAVEGRFDEGVAAASSCLSEGFPALPADRDSTTPPAGRFSLLLNYGHTSGEDIVLGILLGLGVKPERMPWEVSTC
ncbi:MAG: DUF2877 domain-containing protein [Deltaproteobacteria bacterium]|nr:DUF2877 domain-containing protein [Deltaproteobacteria bacterium]